MASDSLNGALLMVLIISGFLFIGDLAIQSYGTGATFGNNNNILNNYGNYSSGTLNSFSSDVLPASESSISPETGNIFTDTFNTAKNWLVNSVGLSYVIAILSVPYNLLQSFGLPSALVWLISAIWYGYIIFLIIGWLFNR